MTDLLVVEDDAQLVKALALTLRSRGYDVTTAGTAADALRLAAVRRFDVVVLDLGLPDRDGLEVIEEVRRTSAVPIVVLSARRDQRDKVLALDAGADDYLTKPFAFAEFSARIRALVRRDSATAKAVLRVGRLELDPMTVRAVIAGTPVALSTKEFALLSLLVSRPGESLTRTEILQEVWGTTKHIDQTIVDQYVSYLRRKLEPTDSGVSIVTVRGVGYQLREDA